MNSRSKLAWCLPLLLLLLNACDSNRDTLLTEVADARDANSILVALAEEGLSSARQVKEGNARSASWSVYVAPEELLRARQVLHVRQLPRSRRGSLQSLASSSGMVPTPTEEKAKLLLAISEHLAASFESIRGIVHARVHFWLPEKGRSYELGSKKSPPRAQASVYLRYLPTAGSGNKGAEFDGRPLRLFEQHVKTASVDDRSPDHGDALADEIAQSDGAAPLMMALHAEAIPNDAARRWPVHPAAICAQVASALENVPAENVTVIFQNASHRILNAPGFEFVSAEEIRRAGAVAGAQSVLRDSRVLLDRSLAKDMDKALQAYLGAARHNLAVTITQARDWKVFLPTAALALLSTVLLVLLVFPGIRRRKSSTEA
ncbi:MAG: hypothetical protein H6832_02905 [Planctomycetes bacterium]|nr:hypothetical protein [Planctomycetota bacterium]